MPHKSKLFVCLLSLLCLPLVAQAATQQDHVHQMQMAHQVMPFDLGKTIHVFKMTEQGGIERVLVRNNAEQQQVTLIQQHLQHEAKRFQQGHYDDPAMLHGKDMPGLQALQQNANRIRISYQALENGAEIHFEATDLHLITAIHRWFGAQLSEHGADAKAE